MKDKIKVLVISDKSGGVAYYRSLMPHIKLDELMPEDFDIDIVNDFNFEDLEKLSKYNIITFNQGLFPKYQEYIDAMKFCKDNGIKIVLDLDDYWDLPESHGMYSWYKSSKMSDKIVNNIRIADYVTTTTEIFADKIRKYNKNVVVIPNAIDPDTPQFAPDKKKLPKEFTKDRKLRIGFILGSSHLKDMEQMDGLVQSLDKETLDRIQFVLCGFDTSGTVSYIDPKTLEMTERPIYPTETSWFSYERYITNDYKAVSEEYRNFLLDFRKNEQYDKVDQEIYRRQWTRDIDSYATHYDDIDVLFVPLYESEFNSCKSELKMIEAGFKNKAIVMTDFGPYKIGSKSIIEKGGKINEEGNCILIDPAKKHKEWAKVIKKLVNNPSLIETMRKNLRKMITPEYDLNKVTKKRAKFYKDIVSK